MVAVLTLLKILLYVNKLDCIYIVCIYSTAIISHVFIVLFLYNVLIAKLKDLELEDGKIEEANVYQ